MLLQLLVTRLGPLILMKYCKERRRIKSVMVLLVLIYGIAFITSFFRIAAEESLKGVCLFFISMLPHYLIYGFSACLMVRCIWKMWSKRVWNRISALSIFLTMIGILCEKYINPSFIHFFENFLK